jgi:hypothetical protein
MIKKVFFLFFLFSCFLANAQKLSKDFRSKKILIQKDTIQLDSVSINSYNFKIINSNLQTIAPSEYLIDFPKARLIISSKKHTEITIEYYRFPEFLTKIYSPFDKKLIVPNTNNTGQLYSLTTNKKASEITLFDGLQTKGFISRGMRVGNNQNAVTNASLDLEIQGKLSNNVSLRAHIFDTNVPLQQNGYSQNITDFDRIFIEMFSDNWRVKAGDITLANKQSFFFPFTKQVAGLEVQASVNKNLSVGASGAIVRGKFMSYAFIGSEGNQGPYKVYGPNNESAIVIIAGSETVYINGTPIKSGENEDYIIDDNLAEIRFNTTFPITNDMRITVEFQFSDRNYTRFITYEKATYQGENFMINGYFYNENDAKDQPLQQNLSDKQKKILANAGNNQEDMVSESAYIDDYAENKIVYEKVPNGNDEIFEYSTNENVVVYAVTFTNVGSNQGDYSFERSIAIGNIFKYVGKNQGDYLPVVRLSAPTKHQVAVVNGNYQPNEKVNFTAELAFSNNDQNLFSSIDDNTNKGIASLLGWKQTLIDRKWQLKSDVNFEFKQAHFFTEQRFEPIEFKRDWNLISTVGNKSLLQTKITLQNRENDFLSYSFNQLNYTNNFTGTKHHFTSKMSLSKTTFFVDGSLLNSASIQEKNSFLRIRAKAEQQFTKSWLGAFILAETNNRTDKGNNDFINTSHRFKEYESYFGLGDSTNVFAKIGINYRNNDSIKQNKFTEINNRKTLYIQSKIVQNKNTNLAVFANYRITENAFTNDEKTLNSKVVFNQRLFNDLMILGTVYETSSGNVAQQDYVYVKTEPGFGFYTWIDYNDNGTQEFNEFEIAQFQDQAAYLRVPLPNLRYLSTQRAKMNQSFTLDLHQWNNKNGLKKTLSHFYNQSFLSLENEQKRAGNSFNLNPFDLDETKLIGLNFSFRNSLYFNRNLQKTSLTYTYGTSKNKQQYLIGNQENNLVFNQVAYQHKFATYWLFDLMGKIDQNTLTTENFNNRNYEITSKEVSPKISYLLNKDNRLTAFYEFRIKKNKQEGFEGLNQHKFGLNYFYLNKKQQQFSANITTFLNDFTGSTNSPVAYQMLEGLQAGKNYTWNLLFSQKLNSFLNLNLNYLGRKSENSKTIHTGNIELRANF